MDAKEAYKKATEKLNENSGKEINDVLELIKSESEKGKYVTRTNNILCKATVKYLKKLGYNVAYHYYDSSSYYRISYYRISWENKKESWLDKWIEKLKDSKN